MGLDALLARLEGRAVTPVTPAKTPAVTGKAAQLVPCTAVTAVTAQNDAKANEAAREPFDREAWEEWAAAELPKPDPWRVTRCGDCGYFKRIDHPHLGHCATGEPEPLAGLWDSDRRHCAQYKPHTRS